MRAAIRIFGAATIASLAFLAAAPAVAFAADSDGDGVPDNADAFPNNAALAAESYAPAYKEFGQIFFEDLWPSQGDFDFNDESIAYNYLFQLDARGKLKNLKGSFTLMSAGASFHNRVIVHLPIPVGAVGSVTLNGLGQAVVPVTSKPGESQLTVEITPDTLAVLGDTLVNTEANKPSQAGVPFNLLVTLSTPTAIDLGLAPFDVYLERTFAAGHEIHLPQYGGSTTMDVSLFGTADDGSTANRHFVTKNGIPFGLVVPYRVAWPLEFVRIDTAYPNIIPFGNSGGATDTDWYLTNVNSASLWTGGANNTPPPVAQIIPPDFPGPTNPCFNQPNGTACDDGNLCTKQDACNNGLCVGVAYACAAPDACHQAGACLGDGSCSVINQPDGTVCGSVTNGSATCNAGACSGLTCNVGFGNCDNNAGNGCELNLLTDSNNCGSCGHACGGGISCQSGSCVGAAACSTGKDATGANYVICAATAAGAWIAGNFQNGVSCTYHPLVICQQYGYSRTGRYGGTCGTICGYCLGQGNRCGQVANFAPGGNYTTFDNGGGNPNNVLSCTVHWECLP